MNCLLARRLIERGVRFVELFHEAWDQHGNLVGDLKKNSYSCDGRCAPRNAVRKASIEIVTSSGLGFPAPCSPGAMREYRFLQSRPDFYCFGDSPQIFGTRKPAGLGAWMTPGLVKCSFSGPAWRAANLPKSNPEFGASLSGRTRWRSRFAPDCQRWCGPGVWSLWSTNP